MFQLPKFCPYCGVPVSEKTQGPSSWDDTVVRCLPCDRMFRETWDMHVYEADPKPKPPKPSALQAYEDERLLRGIVPRVAR